MNYCVSIIVPVYNVEPYVARCIDSILAQTYTNWELILIDDGSTDQSGKICDQYSDKYEHIRTFHQTNKGVSTARNFGIEEAKGDYILFVDPDDWIAPEMLEEMVTQGNGAELVVCGFTKVYVYEDGTVKSKTNLIWPDHQGSFVSADVYYDILAKTGVLWNKLFRRDIVGDVRFDPQMRYGEDTVFVAYVLKNIHSAFLIPKAYYYYFINRQGNVVSSKPDDRSIEFLDSVYKIYEELKKYNQGSCGIHRVMMGVNQVLDKIPCQEWKLYRKYIEKCGKILRKTSLYDRITYIFDKKFGKRIKRVIKCFMYSYFPQIAFILCYSCIKRNR